MVTDEGSSDEQDKRLEQEQTGASLFLDYIIGEWSALRDRMVVYAQGQSRNSRKRRSPLEVHYSPIPADIASFVIDDVEYVLVPGKCEIWFKPVSEGRFVGHDGSTVFVSGLTVHGESCQLELDLSGGILAVARVKRLTGSAVRHGPTGPSIRE